MNIKEAQESLQNKGQLINYNPYIHGVTQSFLTIWMECERKARYYSRGLYMPGASMALTFGSVFHDFQEYILNQIKNKIIVEAEQIKNQIIVISHEVYIGNWEKQHREANAIGKDNIFQSFAFMQGIIPLYFEFWKEDFFGDTKITWLEVEQEFSQMINGVPIRVKLDGIFEINGVRYLMEHKTKSRFDTDVLIKTLPYNFQVLVYTLTYYLEHGIWLNGVCYNVIRKPGLRKKVSELFDQFVQRCISDIKARPQYYFLRFWHNFIPKNLENFAVSFAKQIQNFVDWAGQDNNLDIYNTSKCQSVYGICPYIDYCTSKERDVALLDVKENLFTELS